MLKSELKNNNLKIWIGSTLVLDHTPENPAFFVGAGTEEVKMYRGNFKITDRTDEKIPLRHVEQKGDDFRFYYGDDELLLSFGKEASAISWNFSTPRQYSRFWARISATKQEHLYGLGEQMSHFNLRGKLFPIWSSEPGVGRNKDTYITWQSDSTGMSGGDYWTTNYPQASYMSNQKYYLFADSFAYAEFDFRDPNFHEVHIWEVPKRILFWTGDTYYSLIEQFTSFIGRQETLPKWLNEGFMLGIQGGWDKIDSKIKDLQEHGVDVNAVWVQDWEGIRMTSFGQRLMWDWHMIQNVILTSKIELQAYKNKELNF